MRLWAVVCAVMLVSARVLAISTGHSRVFWLVWSAIVGIVAFVSPISGVALSVGNVFVSLEDDSPLGFSTGQIAGMGAATRMILQLATRKIRLYQIWRPSHFALVGIVFIILLSALASPFSGLPLTAVRKLLLIILLYMLTVAYFNTFDKLIFLQLTVTLTAGLAAAWTLNESLNTHVALERPTGLTGNPNYQAIYLAVAMPLIVGLLAYLRPMRWRALVAMAGIVIVGGAVVTASRGGLLVLGISFVLIIMIWGRHQRRTQWFLGILLVVLIVALTRFDYSWLRFSNTLSAIGEGATDAESRAQLIDDSLAVWQRYPLFGVGAGNWLRGVSRLEMRATSVRSAHVWPAQILAELGVLGFGCYVIFVFLCVRDYRYAISSLDRQSSSYADIIRGFFASALAMSLAWTSGNPYNQLWFELLMIGGVCLHILRANRLLPERQPVPVKPASVASRGY